MRNKQTDLTETEIKNYNPSEIEQHWREIWRNEQDYRTNNPQEGQQTFYCLDFFPYPSGAGLSVGHGRNYVPSDVVTRYHRMKGEVVLHPMGWDAFGLPAENEAIKMGIHPSQSTKKYAAHYKYQLDLLGCSYDWEREINSSDPEFYRWNQVMFLMLYERGLAYHKEASVNWCATCQTVLAAEEIEDGLCWRCHHPMVIRKRKQWFINVTSYADELYASLDTLDWPEHIVNIQKNWIGRSEGVEVKIPVPGIGDLTVYTTRVDTLFGVTFVAMSPEHPMADHIAVPEYKNQIEHYIYQAAQRSTNDRHSRKPDGVPTGRYVIMPGGDNVPLYIADYVLASHGTGVVLGVPAHDSRDYMFAEKYNIPIKQVVFPVDHNVSGLPYTGYGVLVNSQQFDGLSSSSAQQDITEWMVVKNIAKQTVYFRLRDWLISRQRYWGTPIPIVHCDRCGEVPVPINELPVLLPPVPDFTPRGDGRAPLANVSNFVHTICPRCGEHAQRETDTMTGFVCSSWYYMRFTDPHNDKIMFDPQTAAQWLPVDMYVGGEEHAIGHLLYSRFWTKFLSDAGIVSFREPFPVLRSQGVLHVRNTKTGRIERMSKSKGNVVTPESVISEYGADVLRLHLLFMGPFEANVVWEVDANSQKPQHIDGVRRFLNRVWRLTRESYHMRTPDEAAENALLQFLNGTLKVVTEKIEKMHFNVAISALMTFANGLETHRHQYGDSPAFLQCREKFIKLLAPFAPYMTEEAWHHLGMRESVHHAKWPVAFEIKIADKEIEIPVQVNGKIRTRIIVSQDVDAASLELIVLKSDAVRTVIGDRFIEKVVVVPQRVVNIVLR